MPAQFRFIRLITAGLAACAVTWALAAAALAGPGPVPPALQPSGDRPAFKDVAGDQKEPQSASRPAFKVVPGDVKAPGSGSRPAFKPAVGDVKSDADRARAIAPAVAPQPVRGITPAADDDTSTVALILSIAAILTALGAVTLTAMRPPRGAARA